MTSSLNAVRSLYERGYLTKEASIRILRRRDQLVKEAVLGLFKKDPAPFFTRLKEQMASGDKAQWVSRLAKLVGIGAAFSAGAAGVHAGAQAIGNVSLGGKIKKSRQEVLSNLVGPNVNPTTAAGFETIFDTIAEYAPDVASNPVVAQGIVEGLSTSITPRGIRGLDTNFVKGLADTQRTIEESRRGKGFMRQFGEASARVTSPVGKMPSILED